MTRLVTQDGTAIIVHPVHGVISARTAEAEAELRRRQMAREAA
jgi:hypothetical protein